MRRSAYRRSGRRCRSAGPTGWSTGYGIVDDILIDEDGRPALAELAAYSATSESHWRVLVERPDRAAASIAEHPVGLCEAFGYTLADVR